MAKKKLPEASKQQQKRQGVGTEQKETSPNKATNYSSEEVAELAALIQGDLAGGLAFGLSGRRLNGDTVSIDNIFANYPCRNRGVAAAALRKVASTGDLPVLERVRQGRYRVVNLGPEEPVTNGRRPVSDTSVSKTKVHDTWQSVILETNMRITNQAGDDPEVFYMTNEVGDTFVARIKPVIVPKV